jgi:DNA helicase-2/ATP-dependent DNA helicase PcrA
LFFVAETRAKSNLFLTRNKFKENGKEEPKLQFLFDPKIETENKKTNLEYLEKEVEIGRKIYLPDLKNCNDKELIRPFVENYKLSITALEAFIDLNYGGPDSFLENNLLMFPKNKDATAGYGTAIHDSFRDFYNQFAKTKKLPKKEFLLERFEFNLKGQRLNDSDFKNYLKKGNEELKSYYNFNKDKFDYNNIVERNFKDQGVEVDDCILTGKIDKFSINEEEKTIFVSDYKTGKIFKDWNKGLNDETSKMKAFKYKNQLVFYKILLENSRNFNKYSVNEGQIEFLAAKNKKDISLSYSVSEEDVVFLKKLIKAVYKSIINLDFPDTKSYSKDFKGSMKFIENLIESI